MSTITYLRPLHQEAPLLRRMYWPLRRQGAVLLLYALGFCISASFVAPQGLFPRLENIGAYKPIRVTPATSTCGVPERSAFCQPAVTQESLRTCAQQFCVQACPYRSTPPRYASLLKNLGTCISEDGRDVHPGTGPGNVTSLIFRNHTDCFASPPVPVLGPAGSFTLTVWLKLEASSEM